VITLFDASSYLFTGFIDLTQVVGGGTTSTDRIQLGNNTTLSGVAQNVINIAGNSAGAVLTTNTAGDCVIENLSISQAGAGPVVAAATNGGANRYCAIRNCVITSPGSDGIVKTGNSLLTVDSCQFNQTINNIETSGSVGNIVVSNCRSNGGQRLVLVPAGSTVPLLKLDNNIPIVSFGTACVDIAGTVRMLEAQGNVLDALGTCITRTGTLTGATIVNNTFVATSQFSCFNGISPDVQGSTSPDTSFLLLRANLWRNSGFTSWYLLRESEVNIANSPPV
jgi:hypothetical protein